jgi:hypothetical protein
VARKRIALTMKLDAPPQQQGGRSSGGGGGRPADRGHDRGRAPARPQQAEPVGTGLMAEAFAKARKK